MGTVGNRTPKRLVVNLSSVSSFPTGLATVANNVVPFLDDFAPVVLARESQVDRWRSAMPNSMVQAIPDGLSSDSGKVGHLKRLSWIETRLSRIVRRNDGLLLSPVPEAPLTMPVPTFVILHDLIPLFHLPAGHPLHQYTKRYVPAVVGRSQHVFSVSQSTLNDFARRLGRIPDASVIPLAVDHQRFRPVAATLERRFVYVGRYKDYKNIEFAVRAFVALKRPDLQFVLAGPPDPGFAELVLYAQQHGCEGVRYIGTPSDDALAALYSGSLATVYMSRCEGFGLPVLEAMASGTAVITSAVSSLPEAAGGAALLVDPDDRDGLMAAMTSVADDGQVRQRLVSDGLRRAKTATWDVAAAQLRHVLMQHGAVSHIDSVLPSPDPLLSSR